MFWTSPKKPKLKVFTKILKHSNQVALWYVYRTYQGKAVSYSSSSANEGKNYLPLLYDDLLNTPPPLKSRLSNVAKTAQGYIETLGCNNRFIEAEANKLSLRQAPFSGFEPYRRLRIPFPSCTFFALKGRETTQLQVLNIRQLKLFSRPLLSPLLPKKIQAKNEDLNKTSSYISQKKTLWNTNTLSGIF